jgi:hypothetical protein
LPQNSTAVSYGARAPTRLASDLPVLRRYSAPIPGRLLLPVNRAGFCTIRPARIPGLPPLDYGGGGRPRPAPPARGAAARALPGLPAHAPPLRFSGPVGPARIPRASPPIPASPFVRAGQPGPPLRRRPSAVTTSTCRPRRSSAAAVRPRTPTVAVVHPPG